MFDIGFLELLLVAVIGLIVLGPERLPRAAHSVGLMLGKIRRSMSQAQMALDREVRLQELKEKMENPYATFTEEGRTQSTGQLLSQSKEQQAPQEQAPQEQARMPSVETEISEDRDLAEMPSAQNTRESNHAVEATQASDIAKTPEKPQ